MGETNERLGVFAKVVVVSREMNGCIDGEKRNQKSLDSARLGLSRPFCLRTPMTAGCRHHRTVHDNYTEINWN